MHHAHRSLTPLYCLHQAVYFFAMAGVSAFAATYLLGHGFSAGEIGVMLASTNILSCILQPTLGAYVDRTSVSRLQRMIPGFLLCALAAFSTIELLSLPRMMTGFLYVAGYLFFSITIPLLNPLCAYYARSGYRVNYGAGNGVGSLSFSFASLAFGYIIARMGTQAMMVIVILCIAIQLLLIRCYPKAAPHAASTHSRQVQSLSMHAFCLRYRRFMMTMIGVTCIAACHAMAENYLIQLFGRIGGGSEHVGVALFLACITAAPFMLFFERLQKRTDIVILLRLTGIFYIAKAILLIWAPTITSVYLIELLQTFTYGFLYPPLYYLVVQRIHPADMAKGQTICSAMFSLGMALGNSLGGIVLEYLGLNVMLSIAAGIACAGTLLINTSITKPDSVV